MGECAELKRALKMQFLINNLLHISHKDSTVEDLLDKALGLLISGSGIAIEAEGGIWLADEQGSTLELKAVRNLPEALRQRCSSVPFGECVCGSAALAGKIVHTETCDGGPHTRGYGGMAAHGHYCVPIVHGGRVLGVITLYIEEGRGRDPSEEEFLSSFAEALAGVLGRKRTEARLLEHLEMEKALASVSRMFLPGKDPDFSLVLEALGKVAKVNRAYIFLLREDKKTMDNTHEWCAPGTEPFRERLQGIPASSFPWLFERLSSGSEISVSDTGELPAEAWREKEEFGREGIRSILLVPLNREGGTLAGFMGFDDTERPRKWSEDEIRVLRIACEMTGTYLERKDAERKITHMAYYDFLTGLPNRRLLVDRLEQVLARDRWKNRLSAVLFIDIDRFKVINDTLGHAIGDELLRIVAGRLKSSLHEGDTVARLGGDEFTVILEEISRPEDILKVIKKIFAAFERPVAIGAQEAYVTVSIGVSVYPFDGEYADALLKNADMAMYQAKRQGRNTYSIFSASMNEKAVERLRIESGLKRALEREEFVLLYQPQVRASGEAYGLEALLRWDDPSSGLVQPADFIPVAEESGIIVEIGRWVLFSACAYAKRLHDLGIPVSIAVNISALQFKREDFVQMVKEALRGAGLGPGSLELELTESVVMENAEEMIGKMRELKSDGVRFSIDDFGTGYSSLSYLKRLPLDTLKIDRSFTRNIPGNPDDSSIVIAIIRLAHSLKLEVTAEGVETMEQMAFLKSLQCDRLQGYFFSRPISGEKAYLFLKERRKVV